MSSSLSGAGIDVSSAAPDYQHRDQADPRAIAIAEARGYPLAAHRARQVGEDDFSRYDRILVMDRVNLRALLARTPVERRERVALFLPFAGIAGIDELPDPYYGSRADFERALDLACSGIAALARRLPGS